jgi:hypothetical protein
VDPTEQEDPPVLTRTDSDITAAAPRRARRVFHSVAMLLVAAAIACGGSTDAPTAPTPDPTPLPGVRLKDIVIPRLPSPYYHFTYDATGRVDSVSFASELTRYQVAYNADGRIKEMRNNILVNRDRIVYAYDATGHVGGVRYVDATGATYTIVIYEYDGERLTGVERSRRVDGGFIIDKTMSMKYDADGNLFELTEHRPAIQGVQDDATFVDRFEQYDTKLNVDGFDLLHDDFFDHLVLLPGVQLQKGNPHRQTRTGDGQNFTVDFTYTYDGDRPLTKSGMLTYTNGPDTGRKFDTRSEFSYY